MISNARFRPVRSVLQPDDWFTEPGCFQFGMPWPWQRATDPEWTLTNVAGEPAQGDVIGVAVAPRVTGRACLLLWRERGSLEPRSSGAAKQISQTYHGEPRAIHRIRLGGAKAIVVDTDTPAGDRVRRLVAQWGPDHLLHGEFRVPAQAADGYAPHFHTMLASWQWG